MAISIKKLPDEPILLCKYQDNFNEKDVQDIWSSSVKLTEDLDGPIFRINDTRKVDVNFGTVVAVLGRAAREVQSPGSIADPKFKDIAVVKPGSLAALAAQSMSQQQYGGFNVPIFETIDEALAFARTPQNAEQSSASP